MYVYIPQASLHRTSRQKSILPLGCRDWRHWFAGVYQQHHQQLVPGFWRSFHLKVMRSRAVHQTGGFDREPAAKCASNA